MSNISNVNKALLDMISFSEDTLGVSENGYDVLIGHRLINGWTKDTNIKHLGKKNDVWHVPKLKSGAAGRYQFLYGSWVLYNNGVNKPLTKENQDKAGSKYIDVILKNPDDLTNIDNFKKALNKLSLVWASIPVATSFTDDNGFHKAGFSYYHGDKINKSKDTVTELYNLFIEALNRYNFPQNYSS